MRAVESVDTNGSGGVEKQDAISPTVIALPFAISYLILL